MDPALTWRKPSATDSSASVRLGRYPPRRLTVWHQFEGHSIVGLVMQDRVDDLRPSGGCRSKRGCPPKPTCACRRERLFTLPASRREEGSHAAWQPAISPSSG